MSKESLYTFNAEVIEVGSGATFKVRIVDEGPMLDKVVNAQSAGKIKKNKVRILVGDRVSIEMSKYDPKRGRIVYRFKCT